MTTAKNETKPVAKRATTATKKTADAVKADTSIKAGEDAVKADEGTLPSISENSEPSPDKKTQSMSENGDGSEPANQAQNLDSSADLAPDPSNDDDESMSKTGELILSAISSTLTLKVKNYGTRTIDLYTRTPIAAHAITEIECKDQAQKARIIKKFEHINRFERTKRFEIMGD